MPPIQPDRERVEWFAALINSYEELREQVERDYPDEDPEATFEMLQECRELLSVLRYNLEPEPPPLPARAPDPNMPF